MSELTPITRVESYLDAIVNSGIPPTEDITRIETFLQAIYDNQVCSLTPITRIEMFLGKISGQDIELPQPVTRAELYLAAIAGEDVELPENPITRLEMYLADWADSGDWTTISGAIVEFITQRAHKIKSCVVSLSPQQDLSHGDPSPTNICPISGWTGCEIEQNNGNFWHSDWVLIDTPLSKRDGVMECLTTDRPSTTYLLGGSQSDIEFYLPSGTYYLKFTSDTFTGYAVLEDGTAWYSGVSKTFSNGAHIKAIRCNAVILDQGTYYWELQISLGTTASEYKPYGGNSYSVTWEDEVFGAEPDVVSGEMPVTWDAVDLGDLTWTESAPGNHIFISSAINGIAKAPTTQKPTDNTVICSSYKYIGVVYESTLQNGQIMRSLNGYNVRVFDDRFTTAEEFTAGVTGQKIVYELATPISTTITPTPITALSGYNAMWSDGGDITVTVRGTPVEVSTLQALNMLLGGAYRNNQTADDVSDEEALEIILGGDNK